MSFSRRSTPKRSRRSSKWWSRGLPASTKDFPYRALGGGTLKPAIPVVLHGAKNRLAVYGLIDSGADYSIFPSPWAQSLGIKLEDCEERDCDTAGGTVKQYFSDQRIEAEVQALQTRVSLVGAFADALPVALLGRDDFFAAFRVSFDERAQTFRLEKYPDETA